MTLNETKTGSLWLSGLQLEFKSVHGWGGFVTSLGSLWEWSKQSNPNAAGIDQLREVVSLSLGGFFIRGSTVSPSDHHPYHAPYLAGVLQQVRIEDRSSSSGLTLSRTVGGGKLRSHHRYCFLFSKHLLITTRNSKKGDCKALKVRRPSQRT